MFAVACAAVCLTLPLQGPRWELVFAASRYDALLVKPSPDAPPEVRYRTAQLTALVRYLQVGSRELWRRGLEDRAGLDATCVLNMLVAARDIVKAIEPLDYPAGVVETYRIEMALLDKLDSVCAELAKKSAAPWDRGLPSEVRATRECIRAAFLPVFRRLI